MISRPNRENRPRLGNHFPTTTYIYGAELLAVVATVFFLRDLVRKERSFIRGQLQHEGRLGQWFFGHADYKHPSPDILGVCPIYRIMVLVRTGPIRPKHCRRPRKRSGTSSPSTYYSDFKILETLRAGISLPRKKGEVPPSVNNACALV